MARTRFCVVFLVALVTTRIAWADSVQETDTHKLTEVGKGIYLAQTKARLFNSNALVVINDEDVLVVDSHITPAKGRDLISTITSLTDKPVTTLINSHYHYDHSHGNQAFTEENSPYSPYLEIIGHEFTRMKLSRLPLQRVNFRRGLAGTQSVVDRLQRKLAEPLDSEQKEKLQEQYDLMASHLAEWDEIMPVAPTLTLNDRLTLFRGSREIRVYFFGRAHSGGDLVVYFPEEQLAFTGDMMLAGPSWLGDGYVDEFPDTLENLKSLEIKKIVPGHGMPFTDIAKIGLVQEFYLDLWQKTKHFYEQGVSAEAASKAIDMTNFRERLGVLRVGYDFLAVSRMYERMGGEE